MFTTENYSQCQRFSFRLTRYYVDSFKSKDENKLCDPSDAQTLQNYKSAGAKINPLKFQE